MMKVCLLIKGLNFLSPLMDWGRRFGCFNTTGSDINACKNILEEGVIIIGAERSDYTGGDLSKTSVKNHRVRETRSPFVFSNWVVHSFASGIIEDDCYY